jgi:3-dehydroquinate synthase
MSDMSAKVVETSNGFHVEGYEKIEYDFSFTENIFDKNNDGLAKQFTRLNRCLAVMDTNIFNVYGQQLKNYFDHYNIELKVHKTMIGEKAKSMETLLSIVDSMTEFGKFLQSVFWQNLANSFQGIIRKEPVLVVGGGLVTDVTG